MVKKCFAGLTTASCVSRTLVCEVYHFKAAVTRTSDSVCVRYSVDSYVRRRPNCKWRLVLSVRQSWGELFTPCHYAAWWYLIAAENGLLWLILRLDINRPEGICVFSVLHSVCAVFYCCQLYGLCNSWCTWFCSYLYTMSGKWAHSLLDRRPKIVLPRMRRH